MEKVLTYVALCDTHTHTHLLPREGVEWRNNCFILSQNWKWGEWHLTTHRGGCCG